METTIMTPQEVSQYLRVDKRTVYGWIRSGELPALRLGKTYRIEPGDFERFLRRRRTVPRPASWQQRFDAAVGESQQAFRDYLARQGHDPDALSDEAAEQILHA